MQPLPPLWHFTYPTGKEGQPAAAYLLLPGVPFMSLCSKPAAERASRGTLLPATLRCNMLLALPLPPACALHVHNSVPRLPSLEHCLHCRCLRARAPLGGALRHCPALCNGRACRLRRRIVGRALRAHPAALPCPCAPAYVCWLGACSQSCMISQEQTCLHVISVLFSCWPLPPAFSCSCFCLISRHLSPPP